MATRTHATNGSRKHKNGAAHSGGVLDGAEAMVAAAADAGEAKLAGVRHGLEKELRMARAHLTKLEADLESQMASVDHYVHANPWQAVGVAAGVGVVAGVVLGAVAFRR